MPGQVQSMHFEEARSGQIHAITTINVCTLSASAWADQGAAREML